MQVLIDFSAIQSFSNFSFSSCKHNVQQNENNIIICNNFAKNIAYKDIYTLMMNKHMGTGIRRRRHKMNTKTDNFQISMEDCKTWSITLRDLKVIPPYYPLDLTHKVIQTTTIESINQRLSHCIKIYDLAIKWSPGQPSLLYCSTNNFLFFEMNIWEKVEDERSHHTVKANKSPEAIDIIIEIRRHDGDSVSFHHLRNALYSGLCQGIFLSPFEVYGNRGNRSVMNLEEERINPPRFMRPLAFGTLMDVMNSVAMALELIFSQNSLDTTMGLQMLVFLTDSTSNHKVYAGHVCDFILLGYDVFGNFVPAVPDIIHNYVGTDLDCVEHHYALQILANVFENNSFKHDIPKENRFVIESWKTTIPSLIRDMKNVAKNPHFAYNALRCFRKWYIFLGNKIVDPGQICEVMDHIHSIKEYGSHHYISLEKESNKIIYLLDNFTAS